MRKQNRRTKVEKLQTQFEATVWERVYVCGVYTQINKRKVACLFLPLSLCHSLHTPLSCLSIRHTSFDRTKREMHL